ncbi:RNA-binding S4 domain-containing protein [Nanchangia anserum]|uniref:RNA-binding S4 domain-containing protein n=1 Tax=Nanchangia anserum TaxID=2692125 RepID=A0A8I0G982_9ACTO|nr:RNA-binding S4 domain-containing protein [Nanchangia anserum]MBD3690227.1 RNA-binding S4 domain-containing protein [Nanchangia anserum]QOX82328.1 RNA-binding S4 domain-containing protein [Nanchangia anserum]
MSEILTLPVRCPIKLGQLLKLSGLVEDGAEAGVAIASGDVSVDGEVVTQRGRSLHAGQHVTLALPTGDVVIAVRDA